MNEEEVKKLQAKAMADLQQELAEAALAAKQYPLAAEEERFLTMLLKARLNKGLSQAELASRLNMQQSAIARIEGRQHSNPGLHTLLAIAKALNAELVLKYK